MHDQRTDDRPTLRLVASPVLSESSTPSAPEGHDLGDVWRLVRAAAEVAIATPGLDDADVAVMRKVAAAAEPRNPFNPADDERARVDAWAIVACATEATLSTPGLSDRDTALFCRLLAASNKLAMRAPAIAEVR